MLFQLFDGALVFYGLLGVRYNWNFLRYFNFKCENELLLVVKPPCGVPDGLVILGVR